MGAYQAFIDLGFQGRLRKGQQTELIEILAFRELLGQFGLDAATVPKYTVTESIKYDAFGAERERTVLLKGAGIWTRYRVETRAPDVFVIYDR